MEKNKLSFISSNGKTLSERIVFQEFHRRVAKAKEELEKITNNTCPMCGLKKQNIHYRRMNTAYIEDESNYITVCGECFEQVEEVWKERWQEYYSGVL